MNKKVKFKATVTAAVREMDVQIQGEPVPSPGKVVTYGQSLGDDKLTVVFQFSGPNGAGYTIKYSASSDGIRRG